MRVPTAAEIVNSALMAYAGPMAQGIVPQQAFQPQDPVVLPTEDGTARTVVPPKPRPRPDMVPNVTAPPPQQRPAPNVQPPAPVGPPTNILPPDPTVGTAPPVGQDQGPLAKMLGMSPEWQNRIADAMAGITVDTSNMSPMQAMATGFVGARSVREQREQRKREEQFASEERARKRKIEDERLAREREEHEWEREDRPFERETARRKAELGEVKTIADIELTLARAAKEAVDDENLDPDLVERVWRNAQDAARKRVDSYSQPEQVQEANDEAVRLFEEGLQRIREEAGVPGETSDRQTTRQPKREPGKVEGMGTYEAPFRGTVEDIMQLPSGSYYLDETGTIRVKR